MCYGDGQFTVVIEPALGLKIAPLLKPLILKSPPFYYYNNSTDEAKAYILSSLVSAVHYKTAMEEYDMAHQDQYISNLRIRDDFPDIPLHIIYHTPEIMIKEIIEYGGLTKEEATKVEGLWEEIIEPQGGLEIIFKIILNCD